MFNVYIISIFYLPLALGILPAVFLVHYELNLLYQVWIHSRVHGPQVKYDLPLPTWRIVYLNIHFYMLLIFFGDLSIQHKIQTKPL
ncbi:uncharacterized protein LOC143234368 isoform X2 [Tachypleus tridentatus]|uniref:uncharacterized protein LOC143234368 isoform X2 n=1 Tax=Tachypleus tridentatus TaxID=6853 RepID=UPI003FD63495